MSHDHVFKRTAGGLKFVGDFDGLYSAESDPWGQSGKDDRMRDYYRHSRNNLMDLLEEHFTASAVGLEVGCGLGYLTRRLNLHPGWAVTGMDISKTAVTRARAHGGKYIVGDITSHTFNLKAKYHFIIISQCLWYVMHRWAMVVRNCMNSLKRGGLIIVSQAFLRDQQYGRHLIDGIHGLLDIMVRNYSHKLRLVSMRYDDTDRFIHRDGLLAYRVTA